LKDIYLRLLGYLKASSILLSILIDKKDFLLHLSLSLSLSEKEVTW